MNGTDMLLLHRFMILVLEWVISSRYGTAGAANSREGELQLDILRRMNYLLKEGW